MGGVGRAGPGAGVAGTSERMATAAAASSDPACTLDKREPTTKAHLLSNVRRVADRQQQRLHNLHERVGAGAHACMGEATYLQQAR